VGTNVAVEGEAAVGVAVVLWDNILVCYHPNTGLAGTNVAVEGEEEAAALI
jgi:hypothetical protein